MTAPKLSCIARNPKTICTAYCIANPIKATTIIHRERSYRLFSHLTCRWESATMKALMSMNIKHANWKRNNESIRFLSFVYFLVFLTSFFAIHYYKISKYACKSTIIISEKVKFTQNVYKICKYTTKRCEFIGFYLYFCHA